MCARTRHRVLTARSSREADDWSVRLRFESLEGRLLLTASSASQHTAQSLAEVAPLATNTTPYGYTPAQVRAAYGFNQVSFVNGSKLIAGDGRGQTIAIVDAYDHPNIYADLLTFDRTFGLPDPPKFTKVNQNGGSVMPRVDAGWAMEIALDVEWAHAIAPGASILLVEAASNSISDLLKAVDYARRQPGVSVVSMSWGSGEFLGESSYDSYFTTPAGHAGVTFVASSGDLGAPASWPAVSPNVLAVGGTNLKLSSSHYASESAWVGSGSGVSRYVSLPTYQSGLGLKARGNPDVSYDADPRTGFAVYDSVAISGSKGWFQVGGTSAGAPQWAALVAIADQGRLLQAKASLAGIQAALYKFNAADFHDIVSGANNAYAARSGYDLVTGRGSPYANRVIADLVGWNTVATSAKAVSQSGTVFIVFFGRNASFDGDDGVSVAGAMDAKDSPTDPTDGVSTVAMLDDQADDGEAASTPASAPAHDDWSNLTSAGEELPIRLQSNVNRIDGFAPVAFVARSENGTCPIFSAHDDTRLESLDRLQQLLDRAAAIDACHADHELPPTVEQHEAMLLPPTTPNANDASAMTFALIGLAWGAKAASGRVRTDDETAPFVLEPVSAE